MEWLLPVLENPELCKLRLPSVHLEIGEVKPCEEPKRQRCRIKGASNMHQLSLEWKESGDENLSRLEQGCLSLFIVGSELNLHGEDTLIELHVVAPSARFVSVEGCSSVTKLDITAPLVVDWR